MDALSTIYTVHSVDTLKPINLGNSSLSVGGLIGHLVKKTQNVDPALMSAIQTALQAFAYLALALGTIFLPFAVVRGVSLIVGGLAAKAGSEMAGVQPWKGEIKSDPQTDNTPKLVQKVFENVGLLDNSEIDYFDKPNVSETTPKLEITEKDRLKEVYKIAIEMRHQQALAKEKDESQATVAKGRLIELDAENQEALATVFKTMQTSKAWFDYPNLAFVAHYMEYPLFTLPGGVLGKRNLVGEPQKKYIVITKESLFWDSENLIFKGELIAKTEKFDGTFLTSFLQGKPNLIPTLDGSGKIVQIS